MLYLRHSQIKADPKAISGSTSYLRVCLAFHSYPHLIAEFFITLTFGPPLDFTQASAWTWIDHSASGLPQVTNAPYSDSVSLRLRHLPCLNLATHGNSQAHSTKGTPSPVRKLALTACRSTVSGSHFTPLPGSFSPFPHGTSSLSVAVSYLALEGGPPNVPQDFPCPAVLRFRTHRAAPISCTGLSPPPVALPSGVPLHTRFVTLRGLMHALHYGPITPTMQRCTPCT